MKYFAASVPRTVRASRLAHLKSQAIIGMWHIANPGGGFQVFDVVMQEEADFLRTKNQLASPAMSATLQQGQSNAPYMLKDIKQYETASTDAQEAYAEAVAHFKTEFKIATA